MEQFDQRVYLVNGVLFVLALVAIGLIGRELEGSETLGLALTNWTLYAGAAFLLGNGVLAGVAALQDGTPRPYLLSAVAVALAAVVVAATGAMVVQ